MALLSNCTMERAVSFMSVQVSYNAEPGRGCVSRMND